MGFAVLLVTKQKIEFLTSIGMLVTITLLIITQNTTQRNIKKTPENVCTRQIKLNSITMCELHAVTHTARVCWDKTLYPAYDDNILKM